MFVNTIYMLQEFASVDNSVLRIHSFDLKAGLKRVREEMKAPMFHLLPSRSLGSEETSTILLNVSVAEGNSWIFNFKIFVCVLFCLASHFWVCRTHSGQRYVDCTSVINLSKRTNWWISPCLFWEAFRDSCKESDVGKSFSILLSALHPFFQTRWYWGIWTFMRVGSSSATWCWKQILENMLIVPLKD